VLCRQEFRGRRATCRAFVIAAFISIPWGASSAAGITSEKLFVGGIEREYLVSAAKSDRPRPTVLVLHGSLLNGDVMVPVMGFEPIVEREGLVAVYPNAVAREWNDSSAESTYMGAGANDDVGFLRALVAHLVRTGVSDRGRVYVTGYSNGGVMAFRLTCETDGVFAAAAAIAATLPEELAGNCRPARPMPMLIMNGTADPLVPFDGGELPLSGRALSTEATTGFLRKVNGCSEAVKLDELPDVDPNDGSRVTVAKWTTCSSGAPVVLYRIKGGGHRVPSLGPGVPFVESLVGRLNHDFEAAEVIWSFFKDKKRSAGQQTGQHR
jgi:polyhydroxybutyrate depolymerase